MAAARCAKSERKGAAIQNGNLEVIELDDRIIDSGAHERGQQMLGGRDQHALLHQAGGVADAGHVAAGGFDFEAIEISAAEDDAGAGGGRQQAHVDRRAAMQAHTNALHGLADCLFVYQGQLLLSMAV